MTRNTERRVEIAFPVTDPTCRSLVTTFINLQLADNVKARELNFEGTWGPVISDPAAPRVNSQEVLLAIAYKRAHSGVEAVRLTPVSRILPDISRDELKKLISAPAIATYAADGNRAPIMSEPPADHETPAVGIQTAPADPTIASEHTTEEASPIPARAEETPCAQEMPPETAPKRHGRLSTALSLIGRGIRTLFTGK